MYDIYTLYFLSLQLKRMFIKSHCTNIEFKGIQYVID